MILKLTERVDRMEKTVDIRIGMQNVLKKKKKNLEIFKQILSVLIRGPHVK